MHNQASAAAAYQSMAKKTATPREIESGLLIKAALQLETIQKSWDEKQGELSEALMFNRRIWTVFLTSVTREDNPLPREIRENVANLGLFVMKQTMAAQSEPDPARLTTLISINRQIAQGLRSNPQAA